MTYEKLKKQAQELVKSDKYPEAIKIYAKLFKENPKDQENLEMFVFLFNRVKDGNYEIQPTTADEYVMRGVAKFYKKEVKNSIQDFDKALELDKKNHYALKCRAFSLMFLQKFHQAIEDMEKAIELDPCGEYYDDLATLYENIKDNEKALNSHKKAILHSPNDERLWYNYGVFLVEILNERQKAFDCFNKAIELHPNYEDAIVNRDYLKSFL